MGAAIVCFALSADLSLEVVFGILSSLLVVSAVILLPLCIRDCREMSHGRRHVRLGSIDPDDESLITEEQ